MVEDGLVKCDECMEKLVKGDVITECGFCNENFCRDCWEEHDCFDESYETAAVYCDECQGDYEGKEVVYCGECNKNVCDNCREEHSKTHLEEDCTSRSYEDYVEEEIKDSI